MRRGRPSKKEYAEWEERRRRAVEIFAAGGRQAEVVKELGVSAQTASCWQRAWKEGGGLGRILPPGPRPILGPDQLERLGQELLRGPEHHGYATNLWTLPRMGKLIEKLFGVRHHRSHIWRILRKMGWSCQKPERRARERDEAEIARWVREEWPRIKGGPSRKER